MKSGNRTFWKAYLCLGALLLSCESFAQEAMSIPMQRELERREAMLDGNPSPESILGEFSVPLSPYAGANAAFTRQFEKFSEYLAGGYTDSATAVLDRLEAQRGINQYEATWLNLGRYRLAVAQGNPADQLQHLQAMFDTAESAREVVILPEDLEKMARRALLKLQVQNNYLREAMATYDLLQQNGDEEVVAAFESAMAQIHDLASNEVAYPVAARLDDSGEWQIMLHKSQFYIDEVSGKVAEAELGCDEKSQALAVEPLIGYAVPAALGNCTLTFSGEPGTTFVVMQYRE